jgi:hypothetical protein
LSFVKKKNSPEAPPSGPPYLAIYLAFDYSSKDIELTLILSISSSFIFNK